MTGLASQYLPASAQAPKSQATKSCNLRAIGVCVSLRLGASRCMSKCRSAELRRTLVLVGQVPGSDYGSEGWGFEYLRARWISPFKRPQRCAAAGSPAR